MAALIDRFPPYIMLTIAVTTTIVSAAGAYFTLGFELRALETWKTEHLEQHRERASDLAGQISGLQGRMGGIEENRRRIDELTFRIGAAEENARRTAEAIAKLQTSVNEQASDVRVMREILERLDQRRASFAPQRAERPG